jgi:hypothetical protein
MKPDIRTRQPSILQDLFGGEAPLRAAMCHASALELVRLRDEPGHPYAGMPEDCEVASRWREGRGRRPGSRS